MTRYEEESATHQTQHPITHADHTRTTHSYRKVIESNQLQFPTGTPTTKKSEHLTGAPSGCFDAADVLALRMRWTSDPSNANSARSRLGGEPNVGFACGSGDGEDADGEAGDGKAGDEEDGKAGDGEVGDEEAGDGARVLRHCVGLFTVEGSGRGGRHVP